LTGKLRNLSLKLGDLVPVLDGSLAGRVDLAAAFSAGKPCDFLIELRRGIWSGV
jgi:hypothetical protein